MFLFFGCGSNPDLETLHIKKLTHKLQAIDTEIDPKIAQDLAYDIYAHWTKLNDEFAPVASSWLQNTLVNLGLKKKGLCWHWSDSFYNHLVGRYEGFEFVPAGAFVGSLREHNVLVVTTKNKSFYDGVVIDGWRDRRKLYFIGVTQDTPYQWQPRLERIQNGR